MRILARVGGVPVNVYNDAFARLLLCWMAVSVDWRVIDRRFKGERIQFRVPVEEIVRSSEGSCHY